MERTFQEYKDELCTFTLDALNNLVNQNDPNQFHNEVTYRDGVGREPTKTTFTREGPLEIVTIHFYGREVRLRFKFGHERGSVPQDVLDKFKENIQENVKWIAVMYDHILAEVYENKGNPPAQVKEKKQGIK